jgi:cytoskeleton protein RodZ
VTDGKGDIALRKQMQAGESAGASGPLPLRVTVGRVDNTVVQVRGKAFDVRAVSRNNVARFEVK